jgi:hypothetical protein
LLLPGEYAVGHTFEKVGRTDDGLYAPEPQPLSAHVDFYGLARVRATEKPRVSASFQAWRFRLKRLTH